MWRCFVERRTSLSYPAGPVSDVQEGKVACEVLEVTLTIKVEREEDFEVLRTLIDVLEHKKGEHKETQRAVGQPWNEEAFLKLWGDVTEQAREAMREIANKPEGYPRDRLLAKLDITGAELGRCVGSVGRHIERIDTLRRFERPVVRDWGGNIYMMPEDVAELIRRLDL